MTKYADDFEVFWKAWPGRWDRVNVKTVKVGKHEAFIIWRTMAEDDKVFCLQLAKTGKIKGKGTEYLPDCWRWLSKRRWEDFN